MKIVLIGEAANHQQQLAQSLPGNPVFLALPRDAAHSAEFDQAIDRDDVVISLRFSRPTAPGPDFRLLQVPGAGLDGIDLASVPPGAFVCNVFEHETAIAEFVLFAMLHAEIRFEEMRASFTPASWSRVYRNRVPHGELRGRTVGILGFGRIGRAIARPARAFGMRVLALDPMANATDLADELLGTGDLATLLARADYLVVACPLTADTEGMIGAAELAAMKSSAVLINVSRAEIIAEEPLYRALRDKVLAGAYLDVWYRYPGADDDRVEPSRFPFHDLPNVACTPHSSAWTVDLPARRYAIIAGNIERLAARQPLMNVVRPPLVEAAR